MLYSLIEIDSHLKKLSFKEHTVVANIWKKSKYQNVSLVIPTKGKVL